MKEPVNYPRVWRFVQKMKGRRSINTEEKIELLEIWKEITGETIWCTTCGKVISDVYGKIVVWCKERETDTELDQLLTNYDREIKEETVSYTKKTAKSNGTKKPKGKSTRVLRPGKGTEEPEQRTD